MALTAIKRLLNFKTHTLYNVPVLVMMPHSRCNCRCVMCDIWKSNHEKKELSVDTLTEHVASFEKLGVREIVFSGGEALMHSNLWKFASLLRSKGIKLTLLSTGLLLARNAKEIVEHLNGVIVSLDGSERVHDEIRQVPHAFQKLSDGVKALKAIKSNFPITGRCVLQKTNYRDFTNIISSAKAIGLDQISFLAADVSSNAFNRVEPWTTSKVSSISLDVASTREFEEIIEGSFIDLETEYRKRFIAESPDKMRKLIQYYKAVNGLAEFPAPVCNAPWVSAVIESDGSVSPCFFHKPYGNIYEGNFASIINSAQAIAFRRSLDITNDQTCRKCVCSLKIGLRQFN